MTTADRTIQGSSASSIGVTTYASSLATILPARNHGNLVNQRDNCAAYRRSVLERDTGKGVHACEETQPLTNIRGFIANTIHGLQSDSPHMFRKRPA